MQSRRVENHRVAQTCHVREPVADLEVSGYYKERVAIRRVQMRAGMNVRIRRKVANCAVEEKLPAVEG